MRILMPLSSWSAARILRFVLGWILGLPLVLFVVLQLWVLVPHDEPEGLYAVRVSLVTVLLVLLGPPFLLITAWSIARRRGQ